MSVPADRRAELVQALCVAGGGVVKFGQAVYSLQNHLQHVTDLLQHATRLHASQHLKEGERQEMKDEPLKGAAPNKLVEEHVHQSERSQPFLARCLGFRCLLICLPAAQMS